MSSHTCYPSPRSIQEEARGSGVIRRSRAAAKLRSRPSAGFSVRIPRDKVAAATAQEIQVRTFARLLHMVDIETRVARCRRLGCLPLRAPALELVRGDARLEAACRHVELDLVAFAHQREQIGRAHV